LSDYYPRQSSVITGLRCACPRCGRGRLYRGLLTVRDRCEECGLDLTRFNTDDGAAFFIILILGAVVAPLAIWLELSLHPPIWVHVVVWLPVIVAGAIALLRPLKAWFIAQHYKYNVAEHNQ